MRGKIAGLAVSVVLLGAVPIQAQVQGIPLRAAAPPARPVLVPGRMMRYVPPAPSPVRVIGPSVRAVRAQPLASITNLPPSNAGLGPSVPNFSQPTALVGGTPIPLQQLLNEAPGLGFDFSHLAAINSDLAVRAIIDPLTRQELALAEQLPEEQPVGFFPLYGGGVPYVAASSQPQVLVIQEPAPQAAPTPPAASAPLPAPVAAAPPAPPLPVSGEFLLVERDGKVIHAIAFSQHGSQVVYITPAGLRRSIALDRLDLKSTEERNAERGADLRFSD